MPHSKPKCWPGSTPKACRPKRATSCSRRACDIAARASVDCAVACGSGRYPGPSGGNRRLSPAARAALHLRPGGHVGRTLVTLSVDAAGAFPPPKLPELPAGGNPGAAILGHQSIFPSPMAGSRRRSTTVPGSAPATTSTARRLSPSSAPPPCCSSTRPAEIHPLGSLFVQDRSPFRSVQDES
jgi:hypothetical protein